MGGGMLLNKGDGSRVFTTVIAPPQHGQHIAGLVVTEGLDYSRVLSPCVPGG